MSMLPRIEETSRINKTAENGTSLSRPPRLTRVDGFELTAVHVGCSGLVDVLCLDVYFGPYVSCI
jgi:hypothetical protein